MTSGGHNILPMSVKKTSGSYRADRAKTRKTKPSGKPKKPRGLDKLASAHWDVIVLKERSEWIGKSDGPALLQLCKTWSLLQRTHAEFDKDVTDFRLRASYVALMESWSKQAARFGLTPVAREQLGHVDVDATQADLTRRYLS